MSQCYQCALCGQTFASERSDGDAEAEALAIWGVPNALQNRGMVVVCDPCFQRMNAELPIAMFLGKAES